LTAAYLLSKRGKSVLVLEANPTDVGGISRTVEYKGYRFDIGGHRFFSKSKEVEDFWDEIMKDEMLDRPRSSRIYYRNKFYSYPLKPLEALFNLGIFESILCVLSYLRIKLFPIKNPANFEEWVSNQFGRRLFSIFFKTYTEKVWGMKCTEISADWAAQRIKGLSLFSAVWNALVPKPKTKDRSKVIKTLIDSFRYPRLGPGMMWQKTRDRIEASGRGKVQLGCHVEALKYDSTAKSWSVAYVQSDPKTGSRETKSVTAQHVISSAPIRELMSNIEPKVPDIGASQNLRYRDFITVALIVKGGDRFDDNWIYIHDPTVKVGRIQNFKSWSPELVPDPTTACYGLEYFCFEGDGLWTSSDKDLIALATKEMAQLGLVDKDKVIDGCVVRQPKAYPVYDDHYKIHVEKVRRAVRANYPGLHLVGRNGMHKYNNQDHAMMTAMLTVENIIAGREIYDVWNVNQDAEYHEAGDAGQEKIGLPGSTGLRAVPERVPAKS
jgi:protoporphyrinogen oxidase